MVAKDAEMPDHVALREEVQKIAKHLATLRRDVEALGGSIMSAGGHELHRAQDTSGEALGSVEDAVRRDPLTSLGIAAGIGFLLGIVIAR
jgi:ElaB/YqjD/DUF883 family membrane-anchored ribosome-binding protein